jgi:hypothetical protein
MRTKTALLTILFALAALWLFATPPSGDWLTWLGSSSGQDANGSQSEFFGAKAGQNASSIYRSTFLGIMAGYGAERLSNCFSAGAASMANASDCDNCVFIGPYAGQRASNVSWRTQINGQLYLDKARDEFYLSPDPSKPSVLAPLSYTAGTMRELVDHKIETTAANRLAFEKADAHVWLSAFDGSDANDGLSPTSAVKTLAGAYNAAYCAVTNGTLNASNEIVVAVAEGIYAPVELYSSLTNGIAFVATGDRGDTILDGASGAIRGGAGGTNDTPMRCSSGFPFTIDGWTVTRFNRKLRASYNNWQYAMTDGIKFKRCDITGNHSKVHMAWLAGEFEDCDIHGNRLSCAVEGQAASAAFGGWGGDRQYARLTRCHVWDNDFSPCEYLIYSSSSYADHCLFEVDFFEKYGGPGGGHNTIIAKTVSNPHVTGGAHAYNAILGTNSFIVVASPGVGYDESIYTTNGVSCVVSNANLTADFVAADPSCPSVRSDGQPDYGYKDSGLWQYKSLGDWAKAATGPTAADIPVSDVWGDTVQQFASNINGHLGGLPPTQDILIKTQDGKIASYDTSSGNYLPMQEVYIGNYRAATVEDVATNLEAIAENVATNAAEIAALRADAVTVVRLADGSETMGSISSRLDAINAAGQHVFFDTAGVGAAQSLYLVTIYIDASNNVVRVADQVTGKLYVGAYNPAQTLADVFDKAVDAYVTVVVSAATLDGVTVTNQTVAIYEGTDATGSPRDTAVYDGGPVSFTVPRGFQYYVAISDELGDHFGPKVTTGAQSGVANTRTSLSFTYYDENHVDVTGVDTYAELCETLALFGMKREPARRNLVGIEIPDTWVSDDESTTYDDPMVCVDVDVFTNELGEAHLGCVMQRKYATIDSLVFDSPNQEVATEAQAVSGVHYFGFPCPAFADTDTYVVGAFATYNGQIWRCKTAITTAGSWTGTTNWSLVGNDGIAAYDTSVSYSADDLVFYNDGTATRLWKCTGATTGDWAGTAKWAAQSWDILDNATWLVDCDLSGGDAIPYSSYKLVFKNSTYKSSDVGRTRNIIRYGHNRWDYSTFRQYLNSSARKGTWWTQGHVGQVPPSNAYTVRGYMAGCSSNLLAVAHKVKVYTKSNSNLDSATGLYETLDTFWLPSRRQMYGGDNGGEGDYFPYWKQIADEYMAETLGLTGETSPTDDDRSSAATGGAVCTTRIQRNRSSSAVSCRLRSAFTGYSYSAWFVTTTGLLYNGYGASSAYAGVPTCVIW